jgi:DNA-binding transcriptional ArsR family regulator
MDSRTTGEVAAELGISVPRVHRAVVRLGLRPRLTRGGHLRLNRGEVAAIAGEVGRTPARLSGLGRYEVLLLAALSHHPLGLLSARAVARAARLSPTTATRLLGRLEAAGLVERTRERVVAGRVRDLELWRVIYTGAAWRAVAPQVAQVELAEPVVQPPAEHLPRRLQHLFWNVPDLQGLDLRQGGAAAAHRLLSSTDPQALAWAAEHLPSRALHRAAGFRGTDEAVAALAENL